jgi:phage tail-like protein
MNSFPNTAFYFQLSISDNAESVDASFQEVSGLSNETEPEETLENGDNKFQFKLPKHAKYSNLVLKRGVISADSEITKWFNDTLNRNLSAKISTKNIILKLIDMNGSPIKTWSFFNAWPVNWNVAEFNSTKNKIAIETLELAYTYFEVK